MRPSTLSTVRHSAGPKGQWCRAADKATKGTLSMKGSSAAARFSR